MFMYMQTLFPVSHVLFIFLYEKQISISNLTELTSLDVMLLILMISCIIIFQESIMCFRRCGHALTVTRSVSLEKESLFVADRVKSRFIFPVSLMSYDVYSRVRLIRMQNTFESIYDTLTLTSHSPAWE